MAKATYWPEKPNDSVHEVGGRIYTHRDQHGNPARLVKSDVRHYFVGSCVPRRLAKVWAVLKRANLSAKSTAPCGADQLSKDPGEDWVITTQSGLLQLNDTSPAFVKGALNSSLTKGEKHA
jgi:hypothetical protein